MREVPGVPFVTPVVPIPCTISGVEPVVYVESLSPYSLRATKVERQTRKGEASKRRMLLKRPKASQPLSCCNKSYYRDRANDQYPVQG